MSFPLLKLLGLTMCVLLLGSCRRDLIFPSDDYPSGSGPVRIATDWTNFEKKETPTGMTLMLFHTNTDSTRAQSDSFAMTRVATETTNNIKGIDFNLVPSVYAAYVFNQSASEFGTLSFSNLDDWQTAKATAGKVTSRWYNAEKAKAIEQDVGTRAISEEPLIKSVEWLGTAADNSIVLTRQMLDQAAGNRIVIDTLHARNTVYTINVAVHIKNIGVLRSARASLEGLTDGYLLGLHHSSTDKATQLLENWAMTIDSTSTDGKTKYGTIRATTESFGLPYGHGGKPEENILHLECLLTNNDILTFNYQVGDKFKSSLGDDLNFSIDITMTDPLPDVPGSDTGSSAFEVTVEDWGDEQPVPLPM